MLRWNFGSAKFTLRAFTPPFPLHYSCAFVSISVYLFLTQNFHFDGFDLLNSISPVFKHYLVPLVLPDFCRANRQKL